MHTNPFLRLTSVTFAAAALLPRTLLAAGVLALLHWQTTLVTKDIQAVTDRLRKAIAQFITPDVVAVPYEAQAQLGFKKAMMVRDPNGHAMRLIEE